MSTSASKLRLGPLPRGEIVKLTITVSSDLRGALDRYAAVHSRIYGESVDAVVLIPHMLAAFIARDRGFKKQDAAGADALARRPVANGSTGVVGAAEMPQ